MSELTDWEHLDAVDLWWDKRQEEGPDGALWEQDEATKKMYYDHEESLWMYRQSGGQV